MMAITNTISVPRAPADRSALRIRGSRILLSSAAVPSVWRSQSGSRERRNSHSSLVHTARLPAINGGQCPLQKIMVKPARMGIVGPPRKLLQQALIF